MSNLALKCFASAFVNISWYMSDPTRDFRQLKKSRGNKEDETRNKFTEKEDVLPAGPDNKILGHTVGRSEVNFANLLHFKGM